jgi:hypothetical protein
MTLCKVKTCRSGVGIKNDVLRFLFTASPAFVFLKYPIYADDYVEKEMHSLLLFLFVADTIFMQ